MRLLKLYSPSRQEKFAQYPDRCIVGKSPELIKVRNAYGWKTVADWLAIQINDYNNFVGVKEEGKNDIRQINSLATMILTKFYFLKMSEISLFFYRLKCGEYGRVYGTINPVDIMKALQTYVGGEHTRTWERHESRLREMERREHAKRAMSRLEWEKLKANRQRIITNQQD